MAVMRSWSGGGWSWSCEGAAIQKQQEKIAEDERMNIRYEKKFSAKLLRSHPRDIFVFGDNLERKGKGGQAVIRDEPNAFGVPTKREPRRAAEAYFSDQEDEMEAMVQSLRELYRKGKTATLVFPADGLGTG